MTDTCHDDQLVHDRGLNAAVDALMADSGLPAYGPYRATVLRRQRLAFDAYLKTIQGHPGSSANILAIINERDRLVSMVDEALRDAFDREADGWRAADGTLCCEREDAFAALIAKTAPVEAQSADTLGDGADLAAELSGEPPLTSDRVAQPIRVWLAMNRNPAEPFAVYGAARSAQFPADAPHDVVAEVQYVRADAIADTATLSPEQRDAVIAGIQHLLGEAAAVGELRVVNPLLRSALAVLEGREPLHPPHGR